MNEPVTSRTERANSALRRVLDIATRILRGLTTLAMVAGTGGAAAWLVWVLDAPPTGSDAWVVRAVVLAILLAPPATLLQFVAGLRDLAELPRRARTLPADVRASAVELGERSRRRSEPRGLFGVVVALFRLGRIVLGSREVLSPYAAVTAALRPAILLAALVAAIAAIVEVPASVLAVLILLVA